MQKEEKPSAEKKLSQLEKAYQDSKTVSYTELDKLKKELNLWDIVCVKEQMNKPYILVGREEDPDSREWMIFTGDSKEIIMKCYEWIESGKKLYQSKARTVEEMDLLRQAIIAVGIIGTLDQDEEFINNLMQVVVFDTAVSWYKNDHPDKKDSPKEQISEIEEFTAYVDTVVRYVERLNNYLATIHESATAYAENDKTP